MTRQEFTDLVAAIDRMGRETAARVVAEMTGADEIEPTYGNMLWCARRARQMEHAA